MLYNFINHIDHTMNTKEIHILCSLNKMTYESLILFFNYLITPANPQKVVYIILYLCIRTFL